MNRLAVSGYIVLSLLSSPAQSERYAVFDPPGSTSTIVTGINAANQVTGWSFQAGEPFNAFIRNPDGTIKSFNLRNKGQPLSTQPQSINESGDVTGIYYDIHGVQNGFIRTANGKITKFPGPAGDLQSVSINGQDDVAGHFWNGQRWVGFVRRADGTITTIDPLGASLTYAISINDNQYVAGRFTIGSGHTRGFLLGPGGQFTDITPPDPASRFPGRLYVSAINGPGQITGEYERETETEFSARGYLRAPNGAVILFDAPNAASTTGIAINDNGVIAGYFDDKDNFTTHGFVRDTDGNIAVFDPPGSTSTDVGGINADGWIAGRFSEGGMSHGYLRMP